MKHNNMPPGYTVGPLSRSQISSLNNLLNGPPNSLNELRRRPPHQNNQTNLPVVEEGTPVSASGSVSDNSTSDSGTSSEPISQCSTVGASSLLMFNNLPGASPVVSEQDFLGEPGAVAHNLAPATTVPLATNNSSEQTVARPVIASSFRNNTEAVNASGQINAQPLGFEPRQNRH